MHQESADELFVRESHLLTGAAILVVTIPERNGILRNLQDTGIGDCDAVGYLLHNVITESCRAKWRILHLQNGESCRDTCITSGF